MTTWRFPWLTCIHLYFISLNKNLVSVSDSFLKLKKPISLDLIGLSKRSLLPENNLTEILVSLTPVTMPYSPFFKHTQLSLSIWGLITHLTDEAVWIGSPLSTRSPSLLQICTSGLFPPLTKFFIVHKMFSKGNELKLSKAPYFATSSAKWIRLCTL